MAPHLLVCTAIFNLRSSYWFHYENLQMQLTFTLAVRQLIPLSYWISCQCLKRQQPSRSRPLLKTPHWKLPAVIDKVSLVYLESVSIIILMFKIWKTDFLNDIHFIRKRGTCLCLQRRPENVAHLRAHVVKLCRALSEDLCRKVVTNARVRLQEVVRQNGGHIKHVLH